MTVAVSGRSAPVTGMLPFLPVTAIFQSPGSFDPDLIATLVMRAAPTGFFPETVHPVPAPFTFQPLLVVLSSAPDGTAVSVTPLVAPAISTRTPCATGSIGGLNGA